MVKAGISITNTEALQTLVESRDLSVGRVESALRFTGPSSSDCTTFHSHVSESWFRWNWRGKGELYVFLTNFSSKLANAKDSKWNTALEQETTSLIETPDSSMPQLVQIDLYTSFSSCF